MMLSMRSPLFRAVVLAALAIASPGAEFSHGIAHHDDAHSAAAGHSAATATAVAPQDHAPQHEHDRVGEAIRVRGDFPSFASLPAAHQHVGTPTPIARRSLPISERSLVVGRSSGPPPKLRAPPVD
ncbi:MAG: hypothetical protein H0T48_10060 [Gemmatimonadaceae bacterium]|nr:hypothetical protein [Gemmatimonadaceae bacterium]